MNFETSMYSEAIALVEPSRRPHVEGCIAEAMKLAAHWGSDPEQAGIAALLHDCTKKLTRTEHLNLCKEYGIMTETLERYGTKPLHALTGSVLAKVRFGVQDPVADAIRWHTTGRAAMSMLEKILYLADYIEPTRDFDGVGPVREMAYMDINRALRIALGNTICEICSLGRPICPDTLEAYNYFLL